MDINLIEIAEDYRTNINFSDVHTSKTPNEYTDTQQNTVRNI